MQIVEAPILTQTDRRERLRYLIRKQSLLEGSDFLLSSGQTSRIYFDMKKTMLDTEGLDLIAEEVLDLLEGVEVKYIGGLGLGAVPIIAAVCVKSAGRRPIQGFIVRDQRKGHGTNKIVEGYLQKGANVIVVDDVTTEGSSVLQAIDAARAMGCRVDKAITIVDRLEGAMENLAKQGVELVPLFTMRDFID